METAGRPQEGRFNQASKARVASAEHSQMRWESRSTTSVIFQPET